MTPNRNGLSPETADVFFSQTVDPNYQAGLAWGRTDAVPADDSSQRQPVRRRSRSKTRTSTLAAASGCRRDFPRARSIPVPSVNDVPNPFPDIIGKIAFDPKIGRTHQHIDAAVLVRRFKTYSLDTDTTFSKTAIGGELTRRGRADPLGSPDRHRLLFLGRRPLHRQYQSARLDRQPRRQHDPGDHLVVVDRHRDSGRQQDRASMRTTARRTRSRRHHRCRRQRDRIRCAGLNCGERTDRRSHGRPHPYLFRDPKIGGMQFIGSISYVRRTPFSATAGTPADASVNMIYLTVRYFLP